MVQRAAPKPSAPPAPRPGEMLPGFSLPSSRGVPLGPATYKRHRNLALVFTHGEGCARCAESLRAFAASASGFVEEDSEVLVVAPVPAERAKPLAERLGLPFPVLADADGAIHARYGVPDGSAVFVADRYGEIRETWIAGAEHDPSPLPEDVLGWLRLIELECPE